MPKTPQQIARDVDKILANTSYALRHKPTPRSVAPASRIEIPKLRVTKIYPQQVDEWYSVVVEFKWATPFGIEAYHEAVRAEDEAWFAANPNKVHVGLFPLERAVSAHIRREIVRSPQWVEFFKKSGGAPRFTEKDIDNWDFDAYGGNASASTHASDE